MVKSTMEQLQNRWLTLIVVILVQNGKGSEAIQCYRCKVASFVYTDTIPICKDFDLSERFIVDCPYSTWCVKTNRFTKLNGKEVNGTERYCAQQREISQILQDNKWHYQTLIREGYQEGCNVTKDRVRTAIVEEHCYCTGDLCNAANYSRYSPLLYILVTFTLCYI
ncbi:uncharacterized protein LOC126747797 isoform X2 [Anthonomus grandis grandis]|uniref:uncharacterized protein LOC126747797 isoform X2 n=1 Tax=Anthonomus grandis grandis TaxID=2921223 RepID=UPI0021662BED|nr:uncharacterized protein LOC126747797 isoform X2 [Anthonomus grandis grandis]XP_050312558.1 uncharacterized protein LOC126747797 isoform X2 [Anthonomus grandis grandis]